MAKWSSKSRKVLLAGITDLNVALSFNADRNLHILQSYLFLNPAMSMKHTWGVHSPKTLVAR